MERGARTRLKGVASLGLMDRVDAAFAADPRPGRDEITGALWSVCKAGQHEAAEHLLAHGADINWIGWDGMTPLDAAQRGDGGHLVAWLRSRGAKTAPELT